MSAIIEIVSVAAVPEKVWTALTEQDGIANWWTEDLSVSPEVGSLAEFRFTRWGAGILKFEIAELSAKEKIRWISRQGPPHWTGTSVTWVLQATDEGTRLIFTHDGFVEMGEPYKQTRANWQSFLNSLKSYLETGKGNPGAPRYTR